MTAEWTDPSEIEAAADEEARAADFNALIDNVTFLANPPTVTVRLTSDQEVASGSDHTVLWDEAVWDTSDTDMWDDGSPGSIVVRRKGVYLIVCTVLWQTTADDQSSRAIYLERNESRLTGNRILSPSAPEHQLTAITSVNEDDFFELVVRQLSGDPINMLELRTRCTVTWLRLDPDELMSS